MVDSHRVFPVGPLVPSVFKEHLKCVQDAAVFTGPPSPMPLFCIKSAGYKDSGQPVGSSRFRAFGQRFGDEPYRLVREAAEGALEAMSGNEFYHEELLGKTMMPADIAAVLPAAIAVRARIPTTFATLLSLASLTLGALGQREVL